MKQFRSKLAQVVRRVSAQNGQLRESGGQSSQQAKVRFGGLTEASFLTPLAHAASLVYHLWLSITTGIQLGKEYNLWRTLKIRRLTGSVSAKHLKYEARKPTQLKGYFRTLVPQGLQICLWPRVTLTFDPLQLASNSRPYYKLVNVQYSIFNFCSEAVSKHTYTAVSFRLDSMLT